jgi:hypothetical protein
MKTNLSPLRPAITAIAATIALSSTPLLAQATDSAADQAVPVVVAPPPTVTAPPVVAQTPAPAPQATAPVVAPAMPMQTVGTPVIHEEDTAPAASGSAATPPRIAPVKRAATAPTARTSAAARTSAPVASASVAPAKPDVAPTPVPAAAAKTVPSAAETVAPTQSAAAPMPVATQITHTNSIDDEALPIAGGVGLAVIALGGAVAYGFRRRRREREEEVLVPEPAPIAPTARAEAEPAMVVPTMAAPITGTMPRTLPNGFDISRFGRHAQAAYMGPTPDNPSYSLKRRLKRASFFDQREREAAAAGHPVEQTPIEAPVQQAARARQDDGQVTVRLAPQRKRNGFGFAFKR